MPPRQFPMSNDMIDEDVRIQLLIKREKPSSSGWIVFQSSAWKVIEGKSRERAIQSLHLGPSTLMVVWRALKAQFMCFHVKWPAQAS
jgi:hypothetical protein